jgi:hypothetical protein
MNIIMTRSSEIFSKLIEVLLNLYSCRFRKNTDSPNRYDYS